MTLYLDTSSLVKLYVTEPDSEAVAALTRDSDVVVTSALAYPEARATFARRRRERLMTPAESKSAIAQLDADWPRFVVVTLDEDLARAAGELAQTHRLRGADAVHLASFQALLGWSDDEDVQFSAADAKLMRAARALG